MAIRAAPPTVGEGVAEERSLEAVVQIKDFSFTYPGHSDPALNNVSMEISQGECVCITGPSGSGKTTLLLAIQGLLKQGQSYGEIIVRDTTSKWPVGMVFQDPETQILCSTVEDEVAFGPQNLSLSPIEVQKRVKSALTAVGLTGYEKRSVEELSGGEKKRLAIASTLAMEPALILLDEPFAHLDPPGKNNLVEILQTLKGQGHAIIIADHELSPLGSLADRFYFIDRACIRELDRETALAPVSLAADDPADSRSPSKQTGSPCVEIKELRVRKRAEAPLLDGVNMEVCQGECSVILGHNGSGKTTLLRCMAGLITPESGYIRVADVSNPGIGDMVGKVGMLLESPSKQLFEASVQEEIAFSLKRIQLPREEVRSRVREVLDLCDLVHLKDRSPLTLSYGEQHRLAMAAAMALRPQVLILDEPFAGLGFPQRRRLLGILGEFCKSHGISMVITSHDPALWRGWRMDRKWFLEEGKLTCG